MADPENAGKPVVDSEEEDKAETAPAHKRATATSSSSPANGRPKGRKATKAQQMQSFDEADYIDVLQEVPFERLHLEAS